MNGNLQGVGQVAADGMLETPGQELSQSPHVPLTWLPYTSVEVEHHGFLNPPVVVQELKVWPMNLNGKTQAAPVTAPLTVLQLLEAAVEVAAVGAVVEAVEAVVVPISMIIEGFVTVVVTVVVDVVDVVVVVVVGRGLLGYISIDWCMKITLVTMSCKVVLHVAHRWRWSSRSRCFPTTCQSRCLYVTTL